MRLFFSWQVLAVPPPVYTRVCNPHARSSNQQSGGTSLTRRAMYIRRPAMRHVRLTTILLPVIASLVSAMPSGGFESAKKAAAGWDDALKHVVMQRALRCIREGTPLVEFCLHKIPDDVLDGAVTSIAVASSPEPKAEKRQALFQPYCRDPMPRYFSQCRETCAHWVNCGGIPDSSTCSSGNNKRSLPVEVDLGGARENGRQLARIGLLDAVRACSEDRESLDEECLLRRLARAVLHRIEPVVRVAFCREDSIYYCQCASTCRYWNAGTTLQRTTTC